MFEHKINNFVSVPLNHQCVWLLIEVIQAKSPIRGGRRMKSDGLRSTSPLKVSRARMMSVRSYLHSNEKRLNWRSLSLYGTWWRPFTNRVARRCRLSNSVNSLPSRTLGVTARWNNLSVFAASHGPFFKTNWFNYWSLPSLITNQLSIQTEKSIFSVHSSYLHVDKQ